MLHHGPGVAVILVAEHHQLNPHRQQLPEHVHHAFIGLCQLPVMQGILRQIGGINGIQPVLTVHQHPHGQVPGPIAGKTPVILNGMLRQAKTGQHRVHAGSDVSGCVQQGAIQIKHNKTVHTSSFSHILSKPHRTRKQPPFDSLLPPALY